MKEQALDYSLNMLKKKFCLIGVDSDFEEFIQQNTKFFLRGYFSEKKKVTKSINKNKWLGEHTHKNWMEIKKRYNQVLLSLSTITAKRKSFLKQYIKIIVQI